MAALRSSFSVIMVAAVLLPLLASGASELKHQEERHENVLPDSAELPAEPGDPAAIDLTPLVNTLINSSQSGSRQLFSLLSVTSFSSLALHKLTLLLYNISSIRSIESDVFRRRFCYCVTNETNDLTDFTAVLLDVMGNSTTSLQELFKSASILSVSQRNHSHCIYICVMAGTTGRPVPELWDVDSITPLFNQTIVEGPHRVANVSSFRFPAAPEWQQPSPVQMATPPSGTGRVQSTAHASPLDAAAAAAEQILGAQQPAAAMTPASGSGGPAGSPSGATTFPMLAAEKITTSGQTSSRTPLAAVSPNTAPPNAVMPATHATQRTTAAVTTPTVAVTTPTVAVTTVPTVTVTTAPTVAMTTTPTIVVTTRTVAVTTPTVAVTTPTVAVTTTPTVAVTTPTVAVTTPTVAVTTTLTAAVTTTPTAAVTTLTVALTTAGAVARTKHTTSTTTRRTTAFDWRSTTPIRPVETEKPGCPWRMPEPNAKPGSGGDGTTTVSEHKLQPCVLELCKFFSQCVCTPPSQKTRMKRACDHSRLWYDQHTAEVCRRVRRVSFSTSLKQRCLAKMCDQL